MSRKLSIIVGVSGVGKSSILSKIEDRNDSPDFSLVNYGDMIMDIYTDMNPTASRDDLTDMPPSMYDKIQNRVPRRIDRQKEDLVIIDTHTSLDTPVGYRPGLPKDTTEVLNPDNITLITAGAREVLNRRVSDKSRDRDVDGVDKIREELEMERLMAATNSVVSGAPLRIIQNDDGCLDKASREYYEVLKELG